MGSWMKQLRWLKVILFVKYFLRAIGGAEGPEQVTKHGWKTDRQQQRHCEDSQCGFVRNFDQIAWAQQDLYGYLHDNFCYWVGWYDCKHAKVRFPAKVQLLCPLHV